MSKIEVITGVKPADKIDGFIAKAQQGREGTLVTADITPHAWHKTPHPQINNIDYGLKVANGFPNKHVHEYFIKLVFREE